MKETLPKLQRFKVLFLDADGVFFDGQERRSVVLGEAVIEKSRSYQDGQGISFLRELGIRIVFVSGEGEPLQSIVEKLNNFPSAKSGRWPLVEVFADKIAKGAKVDAIKEWLANNNAPLSECAYMGDDLNDREPMRIIKAEGGLAICPANAMRTIRDIAEIITRKSGGHGAIREFAEMVLDARNRDEKSFPPA